MCKKVIGATTSGGEEGWVVRPGVGLDKSGDGPCLAARPAGGVVVTLICHLGLYGTGILVEIDNMSGREVMADMVSLRRLGVRNGDVAKGWVAEFGSGPEEEVEV